MRTSLCSAPVLPELAKPHEPQAPGVSQGPQRGIFAFVVLGTFGISSYQWNIVTATIFPPNFKSWGKHVGFQVASFLEDPGVPYANWSFSDQKLVLPTKEYWSGFKKCRLQKMQLLCSPRNMSQNSDFLQDGKYDKLSGYLYDCCLIWLPRQRTNRQPWHMVIWSFPLGPSFIKSTHLPTWELSNSYGKTPTSGALMEYPDGV